MSEQDTLVLIKPDAVQRGYIGAILSRFERKGLCLVGMRMVQADQETAAAHYAEHQERPFYPSLIRFLTAGPLVALALRGDEAISVVRSLIGPTDGRKAAPGSIRGDFGCSLSANLVHGSDSPASAERELALWFPSGTLSWQPCQQPWLDA